MDKRVLAMADALLLLEKELRALHMWSDSAPTAQALASTEPFCLDTLSFEQWLQWLFLPRMHILVEEGRLFSGKSSIRAMGEVVWRERLSQTRPLLDVLGQVDALISQGQS
ncbi:YqcC family protein [Atopomonas sediminilitoris]|uniref:YqcC family protein n=1 Tax=Atopomonas sediminilitoris TaxID=2919919 RepID=UPI001F4D9151|nr:YqcC family protein [Atopomonas sediminilitoris]MCJ8170735.1 YqcC family protein [Atopomonas sediminilitoris]